MSETRSEVKQNQNEEKREKFRIELEQPEEFDPIFEGKYITSSEFCRLTNELMRSVFADYEGSKFFMAGGFPNLILTFNHRQYPDDAVVALTRGDMKVNRNNVVEGIRGRDRLMKDGDRFYLSQDGEDALSELLTDQAFNRGKPKWKDIVQPTVDRNIGNYYNQYGGPQLTQVSCIDIRKICGKI